VVRYAMLYFTLFVVFVGLIAGPIIVGQQNLFPSGTYRDLTRDSLFRLAQPTGYNNDNTRESVETGIKAATYTGIYTGTAVATGRARASNRARAL